MLQQKIEVDSARRRMPGEEGAWLFIFGDMLVFAVFFLTYVWYRAQQPEIYDASQLMLSQGVGLLNTLLLLCSSWVLAMGVRALKNGQRELSRRLIVATMVLGAGFVLVKTFEWADKFGHGVNVGTNEFFMFYFMFTGIHLFHVLVGLGVLAFLFTRLRQAERPDAAIQTMESGAAFWHLVDLLWIVLFALIYLMR